MREPPAAPPILDIAPLRLAPHSPEAADCVEAIDHACTLTGFLVVTGHGLESELEAVFAAARTFFALPQAMKEQVPRIDRYGFVPHAATAIDTSRQSDRTEYLDLGLGDEVALPPIGGFAGAVRAYQGRALDVAAVVLRAIAIGLGADPDFFASRMTRPRCRLRFLHYPPVSPAADGTLPVPTEPHTDYGAITLLATDGVPGLEVRPRDADWVSVDAPAGALVVNLGDMLARWSNDVYRSTPHRVVGPAAGDRLSIPFFINPDPATVVETIPTCVSAERPRHYEPVTAGEFLAARIDGHDEPYVDRGEGPARRVMS